MVSNTFMKPFMLIIALVFSLSLLNAAAPLVDVDISETVQERVLYNPLGATAGTFADAGENQSTYTGTGLINVTNVHPTQAAQDIVLNLSPINNVFNMTFSAGNNTGYVTNFNTAGNYVILTIPDLAAGEYAAFAYELNTTNIAPPLNLTASYSDSRIFSGQTVTITDTVRNVLNASYTNNCVYNISLITNAMTINNGGTPTNVTFIGGSVAGSDATNASLSPDNRTITWNLRAGGCLNTTQSENVNYNTLSPTGILVANDYEIVNSTMTYRLNDTFSLIDVVTSTALVDLDVQFEKQLNATLNGDNGTWRVAGQTSNPTNIDINLTTVTFWVSQRNATGTGFTNPSAIDNDTISNASLTLTINPNQLLNSSTSDWNNSGSDWFFNYTVSASPIVWMDVDGFVINDGLQLQDRSVSRGQSTIYIKELYLATGYWLQISRNITRITNNTFNVQIEVINLGSSPTPSNQVVQVYNFIPNTFSLDSPFVYSTSTYYTTTDANETLNDPIYNGTMFQYAILETNAVNASLDVYGGAPNANNTWTVTYNVTGSGEFNFDDLFLTGVDPLNVEEVGGTQAVKVDGDISFMGARVEYILGAVAAVLGVITLIM